MMEEMEEREGRVRCGGGDFELEIPGIEESGDFLPAHCNLTSTRRRALIGTLRTATSIDVSVSILYLELDIPDALRIISHHNHPNPDEVH